VWSIAIPIICVLAHLYLVVIFLPGFWREIDGRGFRWHNAFSLFVVPLVVVALIANYVLGHLRSLPDWLLVVSFLTIDALIVAMVVAAVTLRRRRAQAD
jgi:tellurite resistance protein TehA-like permease